VGALLSSAASPLEWKPEITHCNDWQSGLIPALLHYTKKPHAKTVVSIHNLMFQGNFGPEWVTHLGLPAASYNMNGVEFYGHFSFLKAGLNFADQITTVSRTYAKEIQTPEFGYGMDGLLRWRRDVLHGIVNGIGSDWHPATDNYLSEHFDSSSLARKAVQKRELQRELALEIRPDAPLLCMVSRLTSQKGIDLMLDCMPDLLQQGVQFAILGTGEKLYEARLAELADKHPGQVSATIGYDEWLSHCIIAGGDIFLMPSRFEPCGLAQMYAMAYGTLPVARRTGGLADTITDSDEASLHDGLATGFLFDGPSSSALMNAIRRALKLFRDKETWHAIQLTGMARDFGWQKAAKSYAQVYRAALQSPNARQTPSRQPAGAARPEQPSVRI
jgi:starch synthase